MEDPLICDTSYTNNQAQSNYDPGDLCLDLEERINPSLLQDLELSWPHGRGPTEQATRTLPTLPKRRRLAWCRYIGLNIYRRLFSAAFVANVGAFICILNKDREPTDFVNAAAANLLLWDLPGNHWW